MKIAVTETRECCQERDLKPYHGTPFDTMPVRRGTFEVAAAFCQHCGQLHVEEAYTDAAGSRDTRWRKWP